MNKFDLAIMARTEDLDVTIALDGAMVFQHSTGEFVGRIELPDNKGKIRVVSPLSPTLDGGALYETEAAAVKVLYAVMFPQLEDELMLRVRGGWEDLSEEDRQKASNLLGVRSSLLQKKETLLFLLKTLDLRLSKNRVLLQSYLPLEP